MTNLLKRRLALLASEQARPLLLQGLRGIERETLRVTASAELFSELKALLGPAAIAG